MIKKIINFIFFLFLVFSFFIFIIYKDEAKDAIYNVLNLWLSKIIVSLIPIYILSNILINYPYISKLLYPILDKILHFECEKSCSLFLLSIITGNPTSSILVINSVKNNEISINEGNRLLRCTVLSSPMFIILMIGSFGYLVILISIIVNMILFFEKDVVKTYKKINRANNSVLNIIDRCPNVMLEILSTMIFISLLNIPIIHLLSYFKLNNNLLIKYFLDAFELTTGLNNISYYPLSFYLKVLLSAFLLSFGGIAIIIQILNQMKKTSLSKTSLIIYRFIHGILTTIILLIIMVFFI